MDRHRTPGSFGHQVWISVQKIANDLTIPVEDVRIAAETCLDLSAYDPTYEMITDHGRKQLRDTYSLGLV